MYDNVRKRVIEEFGSINKLSKSIGIEAQDLYCAFNGKKPFYPKWRRLIAEALGEDEQKLFPKS